jgi:hypothetical protein
MSNALETPDLMTGNARSDYDHTARKKAAASSTKRNSAAPHTVFSSLI